MASHLAFAAAGGEDAVLRVSLDAVVSIDAHGVVLEFDPAAERMFGAVRDEVIGAEMAQLIIPPAASAIYTGFVRELSDHKLAERERHERIVRQALVVALRQTALTGLAPQDLVAQALATIVEGLAVERGVALELASDGSMRREAAIGLGPLAGHGEPAGKALAQLLRRTVAATNSLLVCGTELVALAEADLRFVEGMRSLLCVTPQNGRGAITGLLAIAAIDPAALGVGDVGFAPAIAHVVDTAVARRRAPAATVAAAARGAGGEAARGAAGPASASPSPPVGSLSLGQAAQALGISTTTARRWADHGRLGATRTAGGHRRFAVIEVRRLLAERGHPAVAPTQPPRRALPSLVQLTAEHASQLPELSWRSLYGELRTGFFTAPEGVAAAERWIGAIASAAETANYEMLHEATVAFMRAAERAGASLLERHLAIERFADTVMLALTRRSCPREELVEARRLFASLGQRQLAAAG